ncbi:unnamed protein product [Ceutorhynchus assimilis]|uniref:PWWP domain-containing protein n=1 Tax=Ceutorhynchus assimilis TaxID=467358 RepID=A0A9N9MMF1_9CUCU|nr:unnamed protein product [Ceutorhynchus assimilis]
MGGMANLLNGIRVKEESIQKLEEVCINTNLVWSPHNPTSHMQGFADNQQNPLIRCHEAPGGRMVVVNEPGNGLSPTTMPNPNVHINSQQILGPNGQIINVHEIPPQNHSGMVNQGQSQIIQGQNVNMMHAQHQQQQQQHNRVYMNTQPSEPSGPGRPNNQSNLIPQQQIKLPELHKKVLQQPHIFNNQFEQVDPSKNIRPFGYNGMRPQSMPHQHQLNQMQMQQQKFQWQHRMQNMNQMNQQMQIQHSMQNNQNVYERVPPLHQHMPNPVWQEEIRRKKVKLNKMTKNRQYHMIESNNCQIRNTGPCPNIDVRQIPNENRPVLINQMQQHNHKATSPSFMEDPTGYLAQQTALLNNTINRQTYGSSSNVPQHNIITISNSQQQSNEVPLPSNVNIKPQFPRVNQNMNVMKHQQQIKPQYNQMEQMHQQQQQNIAADSSIVQEPQMHHYVQQCQGCINDTQFAPSNQKVKHPSRSDSAPSTPSSCEDPVTSSMYSDKHSPDLRPIQGGTVSTSNVSPMDSIHSDPPTPNPHTPTPPQKLMDNLQNSFSIQNHDGQIVQIVSQSRENYIQQLQEHHNDQHNKNQKLDSSYAFSHSSQQNITKTNERPDRSFLTGLVTTMASGRTSGHNTITSVLAGRTNTATVSINNVESNPSSAALTIPSQSLNISVSKSPLEMVQSVVSSIQVPQSQHHHHHHHQNITVSIAQTSPQVSQQIIKHSPSGLPPGHILVSSNGQLIMASAANVMAPPPPPKVVTSQNAMPPVSVSPMVTNVTAAVSQVIPTQQVLGQQTVLVNTLPAPFVLQPGVTMTMDGMTVGQNMQIPQIVTGNMIQQQIQLDSNDSRRALLSPETKKKGKKRKLPSQTVAGMLHIAAQQNSGMVVNQQGFPQQIQVAHSPHSITTTPVMQALTIVPSKTGGPPQIVMNGQAVANAQQIINSQPTQQINLLQPVSLINGTTGVMQNIPIQQFIVPNLGGSMVMNADGTATILQDTSNLGMQLQIQNVNGQNVLTPIQNNNMFNGGQSILAAGPAGMVIRAPTSQGKIIQQQHSPGAQFLSPNGSQFVVNGQFSAGQLSPLVASVSPSQQVTFNASPQQIRPNNQQQQEYIQVNGQMGQTLMVPCSPQTSSANQQNTTFVQQNTTIVQQQTTMVANNQQLQNFQQQNNQQGQQNVARATALNVDQQNFMINDKNQVQALLVQQQRGNAQQEDINYRHSVSTQTAVNQNSQSVTSNSFCQTSTSSASSPPDTTTLSPLASGGQSPPTADTTTHTGSTDDGLSPAPSNGSASCSDIPGRPGSRTMAMVHCVSSSEPDLLEASIQPDPDWRKTNQSSTSIKDEFIAMKHEFTDITSEHMHYSKKQQNITHMSFEETPAMMTGIQYLTEQKMKHQEILNAKHYGKMMHQKRSSDVMLVMDSRHMDLFDDDDDKQEQGSDQTKKQEFKIGDLVWGPTKGSSSWPGKIVQITKELASVKWFGIEKNLSKIKIDTLQTLTEGLDSHHRARKKARTSRKLNTQLEKAIQEAMTELDKIESEQANESEEHMKDKVSSSNAKKVASRLRSGQR